jgi:putative tricarboxylic transport membrane protein
MQATDTKASVGSSPADRIADMAITVLLIGVALAAIAVSRKFPGTGLVTDIGSARFPLIYAGILIVLCALLFWQKLRTKPVQAAPDSAQEETRPVRTVFGVAISFVCAWLIPFMGYASAVCIFLTLMMRLLGMRKWWINLLLAIAITAVLYAVFSLGLGVPLPVGAWFE